MAICICVGDCVDVSPQSIALLHLYKIKVIK
uniref:Uncharacterized protein n=1 Tax=Anguilla anguilla TaxID=7936 RepID=A0A0E9UFM6_ANGAN